MSSHKPAASRVPRHQIVLGCIFGCLTLAFLAYLTLLSIDERTIPENTQYIALATISLGLTLCFYFLGGATSAIGKLPFLGYLIRFRAVGALAIFVVVFATLYGADRAKPGVILPLEARPQLEKLPPPAPTVDNAQITVQPRILQSAKKKYFNADRRVRVEYANVTIDANGASMLSFQAAAMVRARFPSRNGPWVNLAFLDQNGKVIGKFKQVRIARVKNCGGYENHEVSLNDKFPKSIIDSAASFTLQLPGGAAPIRC